VQDDLSDADFSDEDRTAQAPPAASSTAASAASPAAAAAAAPSLGKAARELNEFELSPSLAASFAAAQAAHERAFGGRLSRLSANAPMLIAARALLAADSMSAALRDEYARSELNAQLVRAAANIFALPRTDAAQGTATDGPRIPRHGHTSSSSRLQMSPEHTRRPSAGAAPAAQRS
jgi:hypothetical protein